MFYSSTRNPNLTATASQAILQGLAPDGGLYVPSEIPTYTLDWEQVKHFSYQELAFTILKPYLTDFSTEALRYCIEEAYDSKFDTSTIAPLKKVGDRYVLELFHGSTLAFKDMALSILPYLMKAAAEINDNHRDIVILTATSGDTGKAAMAGFADVPGTKIIVFYPKGGVSSIQEQQMLTQVGDNTYVVSIEGNFDDAQTEVKRLFNDKELADLANKKGAQFSSANSMNIGRLLPQIVYYYYSYAQLVKQGSIRAGDRINITVPTGNFGNILAGYYAKASGLPIDKLVCASNDNNVLTDFFHSGIYNKNRPFILTLSPSMDILVSSNLERLLYHAVGSDTTRLSNLMLQLDSQGQYSLTEEERDYFHDFLADYVTQEETKTTIRDTFKQDSYTLDPHTAVAWATTDKLQSQRLIDASIPMVIVSTASPYKFPQAVLEAFTEDIQDLADLELLDRLEQVTDIPQPRPIQDLMQLTRRDNTTVSVSGMRDYIINVL